MAFFFYLTRVAVGGIRLWANDLRRYGELDHDARHVFWKKVQVAAFLLLMPLFMALGAGWRLARLTRAGRPGARPARTAGCRPGG